MTERSFDPSIHEKISDDGSELRIGDKICFFSRKGGKMGFSQFYEVKKFLTFNGIEYLVTDEAGNFRRARPEDSIFYIGRLLVNKDYALDQTLDADEDLL